MVEVHVDSLGTGNEYVVFNVVWSACRPFGGGFSHGHLHEIPVEMFHGEKEMFDEESEAFEMIPTKSEAFEAMPNFFVEELVVTRVSVALQALGEWYGDFVVQEICEDKHKLDAALPCQAPNCWTSCKASLSTSLGRTTRYSRPMRIHSASGRWGARGAYSAREKG